MQQNVTFTPEISEIVKKRVKSGLYASASEYLRDLVRKDEETRKKAACQELNDLLLAADKSGVTEESMEEIFQSVMKERANSVIN